MALLTE